MIKSISDKLKIQANFVLLTINAPIDFKNGLVGLPKGVKITSTGKLFNQVHWFVHTRAQLEKELSKVMKLVSPGVLVWVYYPKGTSKIQTDLTRDKGWDCLLAESGKLTWISLISFNNTWSVFGFRIKTDADRKKESNPKEREIFKWVNPKTREIKLPDELNFILKKNKKEYMFFETLSFTNKKEYIEWVVTAKKEETRKERLNGTIEKLTKKWKNPRNM